MFMDKKYRTYNPKTGEIREYSTQAPCTNLILTMYTVAINRLSQDNPKNELFWHYINGSIPLPQLVHVTIKDFVDKKITQEEAKKILEQEYQDLLNAHGGS